MLLSEMPESRYDLSKARRNGGDGGGVGGSGWGAEDAGFTLSLTNWIFAGLLMGLPTLGALGSFMTEPARVGSVFEIGSVIGAAGFSGFFVLVFYLIGRAAYRCKGGSCASGRLIFSTLTCIALVGQIAGNVMNPALGLADDAAEGEEQNSERNQLGCGFDEGLAGPIVLERRVEEVGSAMPADIMVEIRATFEEWVGQDGN